MRKQVLVAAMLAAAMTGAVMPQTPASVTAPAANDAAEAKKAVAKLADEIEKTFVFPDVA